MAVTLIAGLAAAASSVIAVGFTTAAFTAFALGAGLSLVSRALMPKPDLGAQMGGQSVMTREAASSRKIIYGRARVGGNVVYLESTGTDNKYLWLVTAIAGHEIDAYEEVWFNDKKIWDGGSYVGNWGSYVSISFKDGSQTTADSGLVAASTKWTSDHKLLDTAYMVVKLTYDQEQFAQGLPNISTVVRGKKVWHPNHSSPVWSQNPALCIRDYLTDTKYGLGESTSNIASINTAFGVCNETVDLAAGGTQPRYTMDGVVDTANSIKSNIENMVGSMIGRLVYSGGKFEIHAGEYVAPTVTIDESMMIGEISVQTKQSRRSAYNGVKGVFLSEEDNYILADYPAQISSTYAAQDGDPIYLDMPLPYTVNNVRAQRIAQLALRRSRQQESITIPCNLNALKFKIGDNISVTNQRLGYSAKVFEVVGYSMGFSSDQMVVNVDAIETASSIWSWDEDEEVFLGAGEVDIYDGTSTAAPTNLTVTADSYLADDGTFNPYFNVTWDYSDDAFVDHYIVEWRTGTNDYYSQATKTKPFEIRSLQQGASYDVRVKAVNEINVHSGYLTGSQTPATDTVAPSAPTSVSASGEFEQITINWTNPTVDDFSHVEVYRSTSSSGTYALIGQSAGTNFTDTNLAVGVTRYYKLKAVDYTGNASGYSSIVNATTTQVPSGGIADGAVDTDQIADLAVETGQIDNDAVTIAKVAASLQSTNYVSGSAGWKIQKSGAVEFEEATIRGEITASTGVIGGFTVGSDSLIAGANATRVSLSTADGIHLGHNTFSSAPFRVDRAGALTATSATITGALTLTNVDGTTVQYSGGNLQVGTVQTANIANDAINNAKIAVDAIQGDVIAAGAIVTTMLGVDAVTSAKIADNAVTAAQIGADAVTTGKIADDAVTNALIATDAVNGDSIAANSVTASSIVAGTITASELAANSVTASQIAAGSVTASEIAANTITATQIAADAITANEIAANAVTADAIAANSVTASEIAANTITASQIAAGAVTANEMTVANLAAISANMGTITAGSISSALITGDVTEVYPVGQYYYTTLTSSAATLGSFTLPAPTNGILKRQKIDVNVLFKIVNSAQTPTSQAAIVFTVEKKSKGVNGVSVGTVTVESESLSYNQLLSISGNVLDKVDISGGVAASVNASGTNEPAFIQAVYYDSGSNKTFIQCSAFTDLFSTGNTMYFSDSKFTSAGTWVTPTTSEFIYVTTPPDPVGGVGTSSIYLPFKMSYGQTTTLTDYRVRAHVSNAQSGVTYTAQRMVGTLENIS